MHQLFGIPVPAAKTGAGVGRSSVGEGRGSAAGDRLVLEESKLDGRASLLSSEGRPSVGRTTRSGKTPRTRFAVGAGKLFLGDNHSESS